MQQRRAIEKAEKPERSMNVKTSMLFVIFSMFGMYINYQLGQGNTIQRTLGEDKVAQFLVAAGLILIFDIATTKISPHIEAGMISVAKNVYGLFNSADNADPAQASVPIHAPIYTPGLQKKSD